MEIHAIVDGVGNSVAFLLSLGNDGDSTHAIELMKLFRRVATRYDKLDKSFLAFVYFDDAMAFFKQGLEDVVDIDEAYFCQFCSIIVY